MVLAIYNLLKGGKLKCTVGGYIKENILSKLNLGETEANQLGFISRFPYYANEAMTQICSSIKPKNTFYEVSIDNTNINTLITLPDDFIAFDDDTATVLVDETYEEVHDDVVEYIGYNQILCRMAGRYRIPYKARWFFLHKRFSE